MQLYFGDFIPDSRVDRDRFSGLSRVLKQKPDKFLRLLSDRNSNCEWLASQITDISDVSQPVGACRIRFDIG